MKEGGWVEYYKITKNKPPSKLLVKALGFVVDKNKALDIGAGALRDTKHLLKQGFDVTAIDSSELMAQEAKTIDSDKLHYFITPFADFDFPLNTFDIANAAYSLPFNPPQTFDEVFAKIKDSLVKGGILCGQLFGVRDEWNGKREFMTFHTKEQAEKLLSDMEVLYFNEEEMDGTIADGTPKHWHIFHFIARKK